MKAQNTTADVILRIEGMDCADCARSIERGVSRLPGVQSCSLNYGAATLAVRGDVTVDRITARVRELGYDVGNTSAADDRMRVSAASQTTGGVIGFIKYLAQRRGTALALVGALLIFPGLLFRELLPVFGVNLALPSVALDVISVAAMLLAGYPVARSAWRSVTISREININVLMTIAAIGAVLIGAYTEAGLVMVLFAIGEALEGYTMARARDSVRSLMQIAPNEATVLRACMDCREHMGRDGYAGGLCPLCGVEELRVPVEDLRIGDSIIVKPGERIAMDGRVMKGASSVNQAPITGESMPLGKQVGDTLFAGSINGEGVLEVEVLRLSEDNTISRIVKMVEEAQERRAPAQRFVDQFAKYYTPAVVVTAALVGTIPPLLFGAPFLNPDPGTQGWLYRALELLVVACPCALVISTPVSIISALSTAARNGVLIKGGVYLESLSKLKAIAFDKTGTLTVGKPTVTDVQSVDCTAPGMTGKDCAQCDDLLALASSVERRSEHPLARAVVDAAQRNGLMERYAVAEGVTALTGKGVVGRVDGREVVVASHTYFDDTVAHAPAYCDAVKLSAASGNTPLLVSADGQYRGYISVADTVRVNSHSVVADLKKIGIRELVMLTGDNTATAHGVAKEVGVTGVHAELMPADKVNIIQQLMHQYGQVAMIGDGVNDAPALATATVGIAMGAGGTAQAMETADVVLMADDLSKLPFALKISRAAMRTIKVNIAVSLAVKAVFLIVVLLGLGTMWMAVLADVGASLLVTLNGMRLLKYRE